MKILIIEDEFRLADTISDILKDGGFESEIRTDGVSGEEEALTGIYDLVLLDVMLPGKDGFSILPSIKKNTASPVIMLTARAELDDKLAGLEHGADDYITKPFHMRELVARIKIVLARNKRVEDVQVMEFGDLKYNSLTSVIVSGQQEVRLTKKEKLLFETLLLNRNQVVSRETLAEKIWGFESDAEYNNVEVYVSFVRKKLREVNSAAGIRRVGEGYTLEVKA